MYAFSPGQIEHFVILLLLWKKESVLCALWLLSKIAVVIKIDDAPRSVFEKLLIISYLIVIKNNTVLWNG